MRYQVKFEWMRNWCTYMVYSVVDTYTGECVTDGLTPNLHMHRVSKAGATVIAELLNTAYYNGRNGR
jgi:hypothetical protein